MAAVSHLWESRHCPLWEKVHRVHSPVSFSHAEEYWATVPFPGATQCDWGSEEGHASLLQRSRAHCHVLGTLLVPQISSLVQSGFCIFLAPESPWEQDSGW